MDKALLYQPRQTLRVWIALFVSISLHAAAIAIAQMDRELIPTAAAFAPADPTIEIVEPSSPEVSPPEIVPVETPPPPPTNDESIPFETTKPPPIPRQTRRISQPSSRLTSSDSTRVLALSASRPEYPYEARRSRLTGNGVVLLKIDSVSGNVINVRMEKSTGNTLLDQATLAGFRRWRFKSGAPAVVRCPITFTLTGAAF